MPQISNRADKIQESPIRKFIPFAKEAKQKGVQVYHLNIGQPDIETPPQFWQAIQNYSSKVLAYGDSQGEKEYLEVLASYYQRNNLVIEPEHIVATTGGSEAILFSFLLITDPGDNIIVFEPFYTNYNGLATQAGINLIPIETKVEDGFHLPPREVIEKAINSKTRGIIICNPNNPTGTVFTRSEMQMLVDLIRDHKIFIISDEAYREFVFEGEPISIFDFPGVDDLTIMADSISKRFSVCGARIGNLVVKNKKIHSAAIKLGQARLSAPVLEQFGAVAALGLGSNYLPEIISEYKKRRDIVFEGVMNIKGVVCQKPAGAFYAMVKLPISNAENFVKFMLTEFSVDNKTVMVAPGAGFYATPGKGLDECRIAYVLNTDDLIDAMKILKLGIEAFNNQ